MITGVSWGPLSLMARPRTQNGGYFLHQLLLSGLRKLRFQIKLTSNVNEDGDKTSKSSDRHEDHSECELPGNDSSLHRRSPRDATKLESAMRANEVVVASQQFELGSEMLRTPTMTRRPPL